MMAMPYGQAEESVGLQPGGVVTNSVEAPSRPSRCAAVALATALVSGSFFAAATPASARELEGEDITRSATTNFWVAPVWKQYGASIGRQENYQDSPEGSYVYYAAIGELWDVGKRCVLTRNGKVLVDGRCRDNVDWGGLELGGSGKYVLTANGRKMASWTFHRPNDVPPPLAPATCQFTSVRQGKITTLYHYFYLDTNDQCTDANGYWYVQVDYPSGGLSYSRIEVGAGGRVRIMDPNGVTEACTLSFVFLPSGYVQQSAITLATQGGSPLAWTQVPQVMGY